MLDCSTERLRDRREFRKRVKKIASAIPRYTRHRYALHAFRKGRVRSKISEFPFSDTGLENSVLRFPSTGSSNQASAIVHHQPFNRDLSTSEANTVQYTQHQADPVYNPPSPQYTAAKMYHQQNSFSSDAASTPSSPSTPHTSFWPPPSSTANGHEMQPSSRGVYQPSAFIMEPPGNFDGSSFPYAPGAASLTARCK